MEITAVGTVRNAKVSKLCSLLSGERNTTTCLNLLFWNYIALSTRIYLLNLSLTFGRLSRSDSFDPHFLATKGCWRLKDKKNKRLDALHNPFHCCPQHYSNTIGENIVRALKEPSWSCNYEKDNLPPISLAPSSTPQTHIHTHTHLVNDAFIKQLISVGTGKQPNKKRHFKKGFYFLTDRTHIN